MYRHYFNVCILNVHLHIVYRYLSDLLVFFHHQYKYFSFSKWLKSISLFESIAVAHKFSMPNKYVIHYAWGQTFTSAVLSICIYFMTWWQARPKLSSALIPGDTILYVLWLCCCIVASETLRLFQEISSVPSQVKFIWM